MNINDTQRCFYVSFRPDWSESRPYHAVQCGAGLLHRLLSGVRGFATLDEAVTWARKFESSSGYLLVSRSSLPQWFKDWCGGDETAVEL